MKNLTEKIIGGYRIGRDFDYNFFLRADLGELCRCADSIRVAFCGDSFDFCTIINARSGKCSEDCAFCAQSGHHCTDVESYDFLDISQINEAYRYAERKGIGRFSIVTAGRSLGSDFQTALLAYGKIAGGKTALCASHGFLTDSQFSDLRAAGVSRYHCNIETSERFFPQICTTHSYSEKVENIRRAQRNGLNVCSGGIFGMGETWEDRFSMAVSLSELGVKSIPLNFLIPVRNTPLESERPLEYGDILRIVAMFRFINPDVVLRIAAGRKIMPDSGRRLFTSGANAAITGDMLTTSGNGVDEDFELVRSIKKRAD